MNDTSTVMLLLSSLPGMLPSSTDLILLSLGARNTGLSACENIEYIGNYKLGFASHTALQVNDISSFGMYRTGSVPSLFPETARCKSRDLPVAAKEERTRMSDRAEGGGVVVRGAGGEWYRMDGDVGRGRFGVRSREEISGRRTRECSVERYGSFRTSLWFSLFESANGRWTHAGCKAEWSLIGHIICPMNCV
jgi:hypothetical protein